MIIGQYIVDFCCNSKKIIIELDGSQHKQDTKLLQDKERDRFLEKQGYTILRFNNNDVDNNIEGVFEKILRFA